jgi:hypothetical protein
MILRDHLDPLVDDLVSETDRFALVAKRKGTPSDVATATDPRKKLASDRSYSMLAVPAVSPSAPSPSATRTRPPAPPCSPPGRIANR